jgi:uncharacterized membrane protein YdjX (TVP38/TMEM64 family)
MKNKIFVLILIVLGMAVFYYFDLGQYFTLENLKSRREDLNHFFQENPVAMVFGFIGIYIFIGLLMLPGTTFLSFCAGIIFGSFWGTLVVNIGSTIGATLAFLVARYLLRDLMERWFAEKIKPINDNLCTNAIRCILFFRLVPLFPFFAVNIALSLTKVPLGKFVLGTMLGTLPATFVYTNAGRNLASINSFSEIMSVRVLGSLTLLGLLVLIPVIYKMLKKKKSLR